MSLIQRHVDTSSYTIGGAVLDGARKKGRSYISNMYSNAIGPYIDPVTAASRKDYERLKRNFNSAPLIEKALNNNLYNRAADMINRGPDNPILRFKPGIEYDPKTGRQIRFF